MIAVLAAGFALDAQQDGHTIESKELHQQADVFRLVAGSSLAANVLALVLLPFPSFRAFFTPRNVGRTATCVLLTGMGCLLFWPTRG